MFPLGLTPDDAEGAVSLKQQRLHPVEPAGADERPTGEDKDAPGGEERRVPRQTFAVLVATARRSRGRQSAPESRRHPLFSSAPHTSSYRLDLYEMKTGGPGLSSFRLPRRPTLREANKQRMRILDEGESKALSAAPAAKPGWRDAYDFFRVALGNGGRLDKIMPVVARADTSSAGQCRVAHGQQVAGGWTFHDLRHTCLTPVAGEGRPRHRVRLRRPPRHSGDQEVCSPDCGQQAAAAASSSLVALASQSAPSRCYRRAILMAPIMPQTCDTFCRGGARRPSTPRAINDVVISNARPIMIRAGDTCTA